MSFDRQSSNAAHIERVDVVIIFIIQFVGQIFGKDRDF